MRHVIIYCVLLLAVSSSLQWTKYCIRMNLLLQCLVYLFCCACWYSEYLHVSLPSIVRIYNMHHASLVVASGITVQFLCRPSETHVRLQTSSTSWMKPSAFSKPKYFLDKLLSFFSQTCLVQYSWRRVELCSRAFVVFRVQVKEQIGKALLFFEMIPVRTAVGNVIPPRSPSVFRFAFPCGTCALEF